MSDEDKMEPQSDIDSDKVMMVGFQLTDPSYPFVGVSLEEGCQISLKRMLPRGDGKYAEFFSITGMDPSRVIELAGANEHVLNARVLTQDGDSGLFEFTVSTKKGSCPARDLAELGAIPREVTGSAGVGKVIVEMMGDKDTSELISAFYDKHPGAELILKSEKGSDPSLISGEEIRGVIEENFSNRQKEVLLTAYEAGYYEWPRVVSGQELADELGISQPTLSEHLRSTERKLLTSIYG
jgi:predicted DNA binding protein